MTHIMKSVHNQGVYVCTYIPGTPTLLPKGRISVLKIANIGVNIREIRRSLKVGKRVPFLTENSRKVEKGVLFGRPLPCSGGIFIFLYFLYLLVSFYRPTDKLS